MFRNLLLRNRSARKAVTCMKPSSAREKIEFDEIMNPGIYRKIFTNLIRNRSDRIAVTRVVTSSGKEDSSLFKS